MTAHQRATALTVQETVDDLIRAGWDIPGYHTTGLLPAVIAVFALPTVAGRGQGQHPTGKRAHPPAPWNAPAQHLVSDIGGDTRAYERELCDTLGYQQQPRPHTDRITVSILRRLPVLVDAHTSRCASNGCDLPERIATSTTRWRTRCRIMLQEDRHPARVPIPCPECAAPQLWQQPADHDPLSGHLFCGNPDCVDDTGRRNTWQADRFLGRLLTEQGVQTC